MLPTQKEIEVPLLEVLVELGGQGEPKVVYPLVTKKFSGIREEDIAETLPSGRNKWKNKIQWARQNLLATGEIDSPEYGIWRITQRGRKRLGNEGKQKETEVRIGNFLEIYEDYESSFRSQLLEKLLGFSPAEFEEFAGRLLRAYGFTEVNITQKSRDGGVDGYGRLKIGLATMNVAFQCKRWQGNVGRIEVDKFRGAIQGDFQQGVFFTTSDFVAGARDISLKKGAVPIILLNGESIVDLMIEKGFGVERIPLYAYYDRLSDFMSSEDE